MPPAGNAPRLRAAALTTTTTATPAASSTAERTRERGQSLLARAMRAVSVLPGVPMQAADVERLGTAVHLTHAGAVAPILEAGLRPTVGAYKNLTTWCRNSVYMFPSVPNKAQRIVNFAEATNRATEIIEIDLRKLDPEKLYRRVLDGALIYISSDPIPIEALRHAGRVDDGARATGRR